MVELDETAALLIIVIKWMLKYIIIIPQGLASGLYDRKQSAWHWYSCGACTYLIFSVKIWIKKSHTQKQSVNCSKYLATMKGKTWKISIKRSHLLPTLLVLSYFFGRMEAVGSVSGSTKEWIAPTICTGIQPILHPPHSSAQLCVCVSGWQRGQESRRSPTETMTSSLQDWPAEKSRCTLTSSWLSSVHAQAGRWFSATGTRHNWAPVLLPVWLQTSEFFADSQSKVFQNFHTKIMHESKWKAGKW